MHVQKLKLTLYQVSDLFVDSSISLHSTSSKFSSLNTCNFSPFKPIYIYINN